MHSQQNRWSKLPPLDGLAQLTDQGRNHLKHKRAHSDANMVGMWFPGLK